jgi:Na+/alanine symporter
VAVADSADSEVVLLRVLAQARLVLRALRVPVLPVQVRHVLRVLLRDRVVLRVLLRVRHVLRVLLPVLLRVWVVSVALVAVLPLQQLPQLLRIL